MARPVRVATVAQCDVGGPTTADNRARILAALEQAGAERPDIVALPETFLHVGVPFTRLEEVAEPLPGPTTDAVAAWARRQGCYAICPLIVAHGDFYTNDAVLIDRQGQILGAYSKVHPVVEGSAFTSLEKGVTPGGELPLFDLDFGRVGLQICFDINWEQSWSELKRQGAEIVFWCSAYNGGKHLSIHAWNQHYYVVSAVNAAYARIIGVMGEVLAVTGPFQPVIARTINLDMGLFHTDFNAAVLPELQRRYGPDVRVEVWHEEALFTLASNRPDLSVADLVAEFRLEPLDVYLARNTRLQDAWRSGAPVPDLTPPYLGRKQWN
ncbi:MAG: carbon-nitrogen hydrolase family protein [Anaerolineae bacterium]